MGTRGNGVVRDGAEQCGTPWYCSGSCYSGSTVGLTVVSQWVYSGPYSGDFMILIDFLTF